MENTLVSLSLWLDVAFINNVGTYLDDSLQVSMSLGVVQLTQLGGSLPLVSVGAEDRSRSLTLCTNDTTHVYDLIELLQERKYNEY